MCAKHTDFTKGRLHGRFKKIRSVGVEPTFVTKIPIRSAYITVIVVLILEGFLIKSMKFTENEEVPALGGAAEDLDNLEALGFRGCRM